MQQVHKILPDGRHSESIEKNIYLFYPKLSEPTEDFVEEYFNKY